MIKIFVHEESSFDKVKYTLNGKMMVEDCIKNDDLEYIPYEKLNPIQSVYYKYYDPGVKDVVVTTPTSSGKSGIVYATLQKILSSLNFDVEKIRGFVYTAPTKALIEEKYKEFKSFLENKGIKVDIKTGDYFNKRIDPQAKVVCTTYDSFVIAARNYAEWIHKDFIVIDEVHSMLTTMGKYLIELLALCKYYKIPTILLSATLPIVEELCNYTQPEILIESKYRPVKLEKLSVFVDSKYLKQINQYSPKESATTNIIKYVLKTALKRSYEGEKVLIFVWSKKIGWEFIKIASQVGIKVKNQTLNFSLPENICNRFEDISIAFHNADIPIEEKQEIEKEFRSEESDLRILVATQTLALGVNLPADTAIINIKYNWSENTLYPSVLDILQEEGRAGRFGIRPKGTSLRVFWQMPKGMKTINIEKFWRNDLLNSSYFYEALSILILLSIKLFGDERLVYKSIITQYISRGEIERICKLYINLLLRWGFVESNQITPKAEISINTNVPPHLIQGFIEMRKNLSQIKKNYIDLAYMLSLRSIVNTKNFTSYTEMYDYTLYRWQELVIDYLKLNLQEIKKLNNMVEDLTENYVGLFVQDPIQKRKLITSMFEYLAWCMGIITAKHDKILGEYSTIVKDIPYLYYTIYKLIGKQGVLEEKQMLSRNCLSLLYGCDPNYSIVTKVYGIGYKRVSIISQKLRELGVEFLDDLRQILLYKNHLGDSEEINKILKIIRSYFEKSPKTKLSQVKFN
ncbi:MAG: DEAD/DEAH box helicase [bacterium]